MRWFDATGVWGWIILVVAMPPFVGSIAAAFVRVTRGVAVLLVVCSVLPMLVGVAGRAHGRLETDRVLRTLNPPMPELREQGYEEAQHSLWLGLASMLACDAAAVVALLRAKPVEP